VLRAAGNALRTSATARRTTGNTMRTCGTVLRATGNTLYATGNALGTTGNAPRATRNAPRTTGNALNTTRNALWWVGISHLTLCGSIRPTLLADLLFDVQRLWRFESFAAGWSQMFEQRVRRVHVLHVWIAQDLDCVS
jgi:hypothetical protein